MINHDLPVGGNWWVDNGNEILNDAIGSVKIAKVSGFSWQNAMANARLMARAKDLYDCLSEALQDAEKCMAYAGRSPEDVRWMAAARAVLEAAIPKPKSLDINQILKEKGLGL